MEGLIDSVIDQLKASTALMKTVKKEVKELRKEAGNKKDGKELKDLKKKVGDLLKQIVE